MMSWKGLSRQWIATWLLAVTLTLSGCSSPGDPSTRTPVDPVEHSTQQPNGTAALDENSGNRGATSSASDHALITGPDLTTQTTQSPTGLSRDEVRDGLVRLLNEPGQDPDAALKVLFGHQDGRYYQEDTVPYRMADLDGDGADEYVLALPVSEPYSWQGAALFVIYRRDGRYAVDRSDRMSDLAEHELMRPYLHGVADLVGNGRNQIIWSRPHMIATGPRPSSFFVTEWKPGSFTNLTGEMVIGTTPKDLITVIGHPNGSVSIRGGGLPSGGPPVRSLRH